MKSPAFSGIITALATPFSSDTERVDEESLMRLLDFQLKAGVDGVVVCGSTGESPTLSLEEYELVVTRVRERTPPNRHCFAGVSVSGTLRAVELGLIAKGCGVDALLVATPPYNKPSQAGIAKHLDTISKRVGLPLVAYDIPGRSGVGIQASTIGELARSGTIVGLKDATGSIDHVLDVLALVPDGFSLMSGEDSLTLATLACGGTGVISASANFVPDRFVGLMKAWRDKDLSRAATLQKELLPAIRIAFSETNPVPVKAALSLLSVFSSDEVRLPLMRATEQTRKALRGVLAL